MLLSVHRRKKNILLLLYAFLVLATYANFGSFQKKNSGNISKFCFAPGIESANYTSEKETTREKKYNAKISEYLLKCDHVYD